MPTGQIVLSNPTEASKYKTGIGLATRLSFDNPIEEQSQAAEIHAKNQQHWNYPSEFNDIDILEYVYCLCDTEEQKARVKVEYDYFVEANALDLLRYIVYILSVCVEENVIWGVGRGSSVSSYLLYKLGVHSVDSLAYNLDFSEFAKDF